MNGVVLGIVSLVATIVFGWIGYSFARKKRYPAQLSFSVLNSSKVLRHVPGSFNDVTFRYNDYSVIQELHYIVVMVYNMRACDVGDAEKDTLISVILPEGAKWVDVKIKKEAEMVGSSISISSDCQADLCFKLLKLHDYVIIEGLVESASTTMNPDKTLISFSHRIPNLDRFRYCPSISDAMYEDSRKTLLKHVPIVFLISVILFCLALIPFRTNILYQDVSDGRLYSTRVTKDEMIVVKDCSCLIPNSREKLSFVVFSNRFTPVDYYKKDSSVIFIFGLVSVFLLLLDVFLILFESRVIKRYKEQRFIIEESD